jgi:hypothetical protein
LSCLRRLYALYDPDAHTIQFHRAAYDIENAARKIRAAGLPEPLAERLFEGC